MANFTINVQSREVGKEKNNSLRAQGIVPAVMYGFDSDSISLAVDRNAMTKLYEEAGESSVIELSLDRKNHPVLIQDLQRDPITDFITHVDFRRIDMSKKVETAIRLEVVGVSPAVKDLGGILVQSLEEIEVSALPSSLVPEIEVDVTSLATFDDVIRVSDLSIPEGMDVLTDMHQTVALVQEPRTQEEMDSLNAPIEMPDLNPEESEKKEETVQEADVEKKKDE